MKPAPMGKKKKDTWNKEKDSFVTVPNTEYMIRPLKTLILSIRFLSRKKKMILRKKEKYRFHSYKIPIFWFYVLWFYLCLYLCLCLSHAHTFSSLPHLLVVFTQIKFCLIWEFNQRDASIPLHYHLVSQELFYQPLHLLGIVTFYFFLTLYQVKYKVRCEWAN